MRRHGLILLICVFFSACGSAQKTPSSPPRPWERIPKDKSAKTLRIKAMGTDFRITLWSGGTTREPIQKIARDAAMEIRRISALTDPLIETSDVFKLNEAAGKEPTKVAPETLEMIRLGQAMWKRSKGAFNITYRKGVATESDKGLDLKIDDRNGFVRLDTIITQINLYGLARGYAVDRAMRKLQGRGLAGFMISTTGVVAASGKPLSIPGLICVEDATLLSRCSRPIQARKDPLIFGASASEERRGDMYHPTELWKYRSGGITVAGDSATWVQFAATIGAILPELELNGLIAAGKPALKVTYYQEDLSLAGSLEPFAAVGPAPAIANPGHKR